MATGKVDKINVSGDSRISHEHAVLNGRKYHYLLGKPKGEPKGTVFLVHGWPDISMGWRYQIPMFLNMGLRVVAPDIMGFGGTEAPEVPPEPISNYSFKTAAMDIKELATQLGSSHIILGGHDWGGAIVYLCTPFWPPARGEFVPLEERVRTVLPNFGYQLHLGSGEVQNVVNTKETIGQFLNGMYGGRGPNGELSFSTKKGVLFDNLSKIGPSPYFSPEEMEYYVSEYSRNGMDGNLNWYKTQEVNHQQELSLEKTTIDIPLLFIGATKDAALPPAMSAGMGKIGLPQLTKKEVEAGHWALWEKPAEVNQYIKAWLEPLYFGASKSSL